MAIKLHTVIVKLYTSAKPKSKNDSLKADELEKLWIDYNNGNIITGYIIIMSYTGMHYGEVFFIQKDNIFLDKKYMVGGIRTQAGINCEIPIADKIMPTIEDFYNANKQKLLEIIEKLFYNKFHETLKRLEIITLASTLLQAYIFFSYGKSRGAARNNKGSYWS